MLKVKLQEYRAGPCEKCGSRRVTRELAHVKPTPLTGRGRGLSQRYHDLRRHPDAYVRLCRPCHGRLDSNVWRFIGTRAQLGLTPEIAP